jgi:hypothetical protein
LTYVNVLAPGYTFNVFLSLGSSPGPFVFQGNVELTMTYSSNAIQGDYYKPVYEYCDACSLMQGVVGHLWNQSTQNQWATDVLQAAAGSMTRNGTLALVSREANVVSLNNDAFTSPGLPDPTKPQLAYMPLGPHDLALPMSQSTPVRFVTSGEEVVSEDWLTVCILNDGHFTTTGIADAVNTAFTGPPGEIAVDTYVVNAVLGRSRPRGLFAALYLTLSQELLTDALTGPYSWAFTNTVPPAFSEGTAFHGTLTTGDNGAAQWVRTFSLQALAPVQYELLKAALYRSMVHTFFATTQNTAEIPEFLADTYTFPSDSASGPTYLDSIWPLEYSASNTRSLLSLVAYVRPSTTAPLTNFANVRTTQTFTHDGVIGYDPALPDGFQEFRVPANAQTLNVYAFGAGGSTLGNLPGSSGSFAYANFGALAGKTLYVYVGMPGGSTAGSGPTYGGLSFDRSTTLGGGLTGIYDGTQWLIVASGGGCGSVNSSGVPEPTIDTVLRRAPQDGISGAVNAFNGQNARSPLSGAGGNGIVSGSAGLDKFSGGSGISFVPRTGIVFADVVRQKFYRPSISIGAPRMSAQPGPGLLVVEFIY